jgi:hypothetical protein
MCYAHASPTDSDSDSNAGAVQREYSSETVRETADNPEIRSDGVGGWAPTESDAIPVVRRDADFVDIGERRALENNKGSR